MVLSASRSLARLPAADVNYVIDFSWGEGDFAVRVSLFWKFLLAPTNGTAVFASEPSTWLLTCAGYTSICVVLARRSQRRTCFLREEAQNLCRTPPQSQRCIDRLQMVKLQTERGWTNRPQLVGWAIYGGVISKKTPPRLGKISSSGRAMHPLLGTRLTDGTK